MIENNSGNTRNKQIVNNMDFLASDVKNLLTKGNLLAELGHHDKAISYYLKILQLEPNNLESLLNLGNSQINLKKYPESIIYFDRVLKIDLNNSLAWQQKGYSLFQMNRIEEAISCLDFSIQNDPHNSYAFFLLAATYLQLEKFNEAILCYDKCLETCDPDFYIMVLWYQGLAFDELGRKNERNTQEQGINSSVEIDEESNYIYNHSPGRDEETDDEYYERLDREMQDLGDYNLMQYYRTCEYSEDDYESD